MLYNFFHASLRCHLCINLWNILIERVGISHDILKANYDVNDLVWASDNVVRRVTKKYMAPPWANAIDPFHVYKIFYAYESKKKKKFNNDENVL